MTRLVILGAGGHGLVVADTADAIGSWSEIVFLDDTYPHRNDVHGWPIIGSIQAAEKCLSASDRFVVAIGDGAVRQKIYESVCAYSSATSVIHPRAIVSSRATVHPGVVIFPGAVVNIGAVLDVGVIVNTGATVDHDCNVQPFAHICPGANLAGGVVVGRRSWIGIGSSVKQGIKVGSDVIVGAGAAVVTDLLDSQMYVGVPARRLCK